MKTSEVILTPEFARKVANLYRDMEAAYDRTADELDFSCAGCPDNCCAGHTVEREALSHSESRTLLSSPAERQRLTGH